MFYNNILLQNGKSETYIVDKLIVPILFHILTGKIPDDDDRAKFRDKDKLRSHAGGGYVDNTCANIFKNNPEFIIDSIEESLFKQLLKKKFKNIENRKYNKNKDRQKYTILHNILYCILFKDKVPVDMFQREFSLEHLIPFSSSYQNKLDINRLGNVFPMEIISNKKRGTKPFHVYEEICPQYFNLVINNLCDKITYDSIVSYDDNNKPFIKDNDKYEQMCSRNEDIFVNEIMEKLFKK